MTNYFITITYHNGTTEVHRVMDLNKIIQRIINELCNDEFKQIEVRKEIS